MSICIPKIKICGITNYDDARLAIALGADLLGFVFYPRSPRNITAEQAQSIIARLPREVSKVGVFVNETNENMMRVASHAGLTHLQLHGSEPITQLQSLRDIQIIKALHLKEQTDLKLVRAYSHYPLLLDAPTELPGGSGEVGNWELARAAGEVAAIFLAGGLTPDNVQEAIRSVNPMGVDVSSGVEKSKGRKDPQRLRGFIAAVRAIND